MAPIVLRAGVLGSVRGLSSLGALVFTIGLLASCVLEGLGGAGFFGGDAAIVLAFFTLPRLFLIRDRASETFDWLKILRAINKSFASPDGSAELIGSFSQ